MTIAIIDYGSGNLRSVAKSFERAAGVVGLAQEKITVTSDPDQVSKADRIVLPGVGAFADCRSGLNALDGMVDALIATVIQQGRPFLGICVGMQLMATVGREHGDHPGLDWIKGEVDHLKPNNPALKIPHMGWNDLSTIADAHPVLRGLNVGDHAYFVHSYQFVPENAVHSLATTEYGGTVTAIIGCDNMIGTQFHPEKSQAVGLQLIQNFLEWQP